MNISKNLNVSEGSKGTAKISENDDIPMFLSKSPPRVNALNFSIKREKLFADEESSLNDGKLSPPLSSLGPGAEIKGKICHPISSSRNDNIESPEDGCKVVPAGVSGGRLTFFREGKLLLELSHRNDQGGAWVQVKSKTYWPPSSTATTTSTQHPLRHDTPTTHSVSDDCSSMNSSPWFNDHIRKQVAPKSTNKIAFTSGELFCIQRSQYIRAIRKKVRLRRNPYIKIKVKTSLDINFLKDSSKTFQSHCHDMKFSDKRKRLLSFIEDLEEKCSLKIDNNISIQTLFEKVDMVNNDCVDPTFVSPRKRYLRSLESEIDSNIRKKVHSSYNSSVTNSNYKHCDRLSSSSPSYHTPSKSAINSQNSCSPYSIDSLLSNDTENKKSDSFLRTLLKPDSKVRSPIPKANLIKERVEGVSNHIKYERGSSSSHERDRKEFDYKNATMADHLDMSTDLSRFPSPNLSGLYLNPYFDPRYMMLHSLSGAPPFIPAVAQPSEMAVAVAAAAAGYPFNPLHISALASGTLMSPGSLCSTYPPATSIASQLIRSPTPTRSSPLSVTHSPSPKSSQVPSSPHLPLNPHLGSMSSSLRDVVWSQPSHNNSSHKQSSNSIPQPPQDVPLNLSKPKGKS